LHSDHSSNIDHHNTSAAASTRSNDSNESILLVDDEYDIVNLIGRSLQKDGRKRVCAFTDAIAALEHFNSNTKHDHHHHHHSIVISDIRMPSMNGYEFVRQIKKIDPQVRVILMSAFEIENKEFHNVLPDIKVDGFLQKPFSMKQLDDLINKTITIH
jgi:CheY-like chemotaxis protein